jgi:hypothetical protein
VAAAESSRACLQGSHGAGASVGLLFESVEIRDLGVLSQPLDGEVFHYRDHYGLECDCGAAGGGAGALKTACFGRTAKVSGNRGPCG